MGDKNRNGGVNFNEPGEANIGRDVVGRDQIKTIVQNLPSSLFLFGMVALVAIVALVVLGQREQASPDPIPTINISAPPTATSPSIPPTSAPTIVTPATPVPTSTLTPSTPGSPASHTLQVNYYLSTDVCVTSGDDVSVGAEGRIRVGTFVGDNGVVEPEGTEQGAFGFPLGNSYDIVAAFPHGVLMYRIEGETEWRSYSEPSQRQFKALLDGCLEFQVNDNSPEDNDKLDFFEVLISIN